MTFRLFKQQYYKAKLNVGFYLMANIADNQAIVNITNKVGVTPLHDAVTRGDLEITRILLQHGATPDIKAKEGYEEYLCYCQWYNNFCPLLVEVSL